MKTVIIGSGNVATILGKKFIIAEHEVLQVYGRNEGPVKELAGLLQTEGTTELSKINQQADIYVLAVADTAIAGIAASLRLDKKLVVHTAGSVSKEVLQPCSKNYGILYPLQSLRKEMPLIPEIPFLVDGNTDEDLTLIYDFAKTLSGNVQVAGDEQRLKTHAAAVIVSNFSNHLYALAEDYCRQEKIDFSLLFPLIMAIANNLYSFSPGDMQTGPAIRKDEATIQKHLELLQQYPALKELYCVFTKSIRERI